MHKMIKAEQYNDGKVVSGKKALPTSIHLQSSNAIGVKIQQS